MLHNLKPYSKYKDSGVPWLGKVPEHWEVKRNKLFLREINERSEDGSEELLTVSHYTGVTARRERISEENGLLTNAASLVGYKRVKLGDLVMNIMLAWNGSLGVSPIAGIASPAYCVYRVTEEIESRFLHYLFRTPLFTGVFKAVSTGVVDSRLRLYPEVFFRLISILPPKEEQSAIVHYLDHIDRRIRHYTRAKKKLIKLLEEQKQAIIHQAVTRGLDPNVKLKPSGVEWLGDVPEHWEVAAVKHCSRVISKGTTPSTEGREFLDEGPIRFLKAENIKNGNIDENPKTFIDQQTHDLLRRSKLQENDILFVIAGATLGKVAIVRLKHLPANTNQAVAFIRPNDRVVPEFLALWLQSDLIKEQIWLNAVQSAQPNLSMGSLGNFSVPLPSVQEQASIVEAIDRLLFTPRETVSKTHHKISLLREYRTRLIADVVTGKLDVREAATNLSDKSDEIEVEDDFEEETIEESLEEVVTEEMVEGEV